MMLYFVVSYQSIKKWKQAQHRAAAGWSRHKKSRGNSVLRVVFSHTMHKMDFIILIVLVLSQLKS